MSEPIQHVSDTALWVATYRAEETARPDALFRDPLAARLVGEKGPQIAARMHRGAYVRWSVAIRTVLIDNYIRQLISEGFDTIVNLGAGLDTRPYRMDLPANLTWIEVDYPQIIDHKNKLLADEKPRCALQRVSMDLANRDARRTLLGEIAARSKKILVLTEGVTPYLTEEQVGSLADDLRSFPSYRAWIVDYMSPHMKEMVKKGKRADQMKNAPFLFFPTDWTAFHKSHGWVVREMRYLTEESIRLKRKSPFPLFAKILFFFAPPEKKDFIRKFSGYALLEPS